MASNKASSEQTQAQAHHIAKGIQKAGQSKEQTKLIAAGIEKGIAQYKKQHKAKMRQQDKARKKRDKNIANQAPAENITTQPPVTNQKLPWVLLAISWLGFGLFMVTSHG